jgi:hypothetical protein
LPCRQGPWHEVFFQTKSDTDSGCEVKYGCCASPAVLPYKSIQIIPKICSATSKPQCRPSNGDAGTYTRLVTQSSSTHQKASLSKLHVLHVSV